jgi:O-antigen/teichoic acid export membrane protein
MAEMALPPVLEPTAAKPAAPTIERAEELQVTASRLRRWGIQSSFAIVDQGLTATAGFGVNLFLARWLSAEAYGAFAVAFTGYLFVSGFHNVLLLEPLSVFGPSRHVNGLPEYFRAQILVHAVLVGILTAVALAMGLGLRQFAPGNPLAGAIAGGGLALPLMLLLWLVRRMCYVLQRPAIAVFGSAAYLVFVLASLFVAWRLGKMSPFSAFLLMGFGSVLSATLLFFFVSVRWKSRRPVWRDVLRENWQYGRWLVGSTVLFSVANQLPTVIVAAFLGLSMAGVLRAMQLPSMVMTQIVTATALLALPALSYDFGRLRTQRLRRKARVVSLALGGLALAFAVVVGLFAAPTEHLLFSGKYASYAGLMPVLALVPVANGFAAGYSIALRASQKPQFDLLGNAMAAPVGLVSALLLVRWWGIYGAATSMILSFTVFAVVTFACFRASLRNGVGGQA